jgi:hypothetical protein
MQHSLCFNTRKTDLSVSMLKDMFLIKILVHVTSYIPVCMFICLMAYPLGRAAKSVGLQVLDCWIAGSNPAQDIDVLVSCVICNVRSGLYDGLITRAEDFCRVCVFLIVCDVETSKRGGIGPIWAVATLPKGSLTRAVLLPKCVNNVNIVSEVDMDG